MITPIVVPKLGMTQKDIIVVKWLLSDNEDIKKDQAVVNLETAKVTFEVEAPSAGLLFILKKVKEKVNVGDTLGVVAESIEEFEEYKATTVSEPTDDVLGLGFDDDDQEDGIRLTFDGDSDETAPPPDTIQADVGDKVVLDRISFTGMRRAIGDNLLSSLQHSAQLTVVSEVDFTELSDFRSEFILDHGGDKISFVDMLVKLLAFTLKKFPVINSSFVGEEIILWGEYHIGVAVALDNGLVVPVVRNADKKSLMSVSREIRKLAKKARNNQLTPEQYQGSTFTLSSGGPVDVDFMTPIINQPENAILGIGKIGKKPIVLNDKIIVRTMANLCLTHDHRAIDGVPAGLFISELKKMIEQPVLFRKILK